jgi:glutaredoxin/glutathione-dependent peroxiredoxin
LSRAGSALPRKNWLPSTRAPVDSPWPSGNLRPMAIEPGQKIPSVTIKQATSEGGSDVDPSVLFAGKKVVMFSLPGAFTPTCSTKHLPGYVAEFDNLRAKGVDLVACLSVNDWFVMQAWAREHDALDKIVMLADGSAAFSKALGIDADLTAAGMGIRCRRGLFVIEDNVVKSIELEAPGKFEVSSADACKVKLG